VIGLTDIEGAAILVVDDDPLVLEYLYSLLTANNYPVVCCDSALDALSRLEGNDLALVLFPFQ
jgi:CheY-like chemotaxis protein